MARLKTVTRRRWAARTARQFRAGTLHQAWSRVPFAAGARKLGLIRAAADAYQERLGDMPLSDLLAEGGMCATLPEFLELIQGTPDELIWVARFEVLEVYQ